MIFFETFLANSSGGFGVLKHFSNKKSFFFHLYLSSFSLDFLDLLFHLLFPFLFSSLVLSCLVFFSFVLSCLLLFFFCLVSPLPSSLLSLCLSFSLFLSLSLSSLSLCLPFPLFLSLSLSVSISVSV